MACLLLFRWGKSASRLPPPAGNSRIPPDFMSLKDTFQTIKQELGKPYEDLEFLLRSLKSVLEKNGEIIATGAGAAALGSPVNAVAWLANTLGEFGIPLVAGEVILSGSLAALIPVQAGDSMNMRIGGLGSASVRFV